MPAFPDGPRRSWVAYGTGIHAVSGLGELAGGGFAAPCVAYPDPVAGFTGALAAVAAVVAAERGRRFISAEVSLFAATAPLLAFPPATAPWSPCDGANVGRWLLDLGLETGEFVEHTVTGLSLRHPRGPFVAMSA